MVQGEGEVGFAVTTKVPLKFVLFVPSGTLWILMRLPTGAKVLGGAVDGFSVIVAMQVVTDMTIPHPPPDVVVP